jgi:GMP synthase-like glutamine amidotransferase
MKVVAVTHGEDVGPELLGDVIREDGHEIVEWDIGERGAPPDEFDALLVLGGSQNVGEEHEHPWLHEEYEFLQRALAEGLPLLGVCLGAETLAHAAGGQVEKARAPFLGFFPTELTESGREDPVLGALPDRFEALNANGYTCRLPPQGVALAESGPLTQAFRVGERAWGVQFHPEVRRDQIMRWFEHDGLLTDELRRAVDDGISAWQALGRTLGRAFLQTASR